MKATALLAFLAAVLALAVPAATRADDPQGCGAAECVGTTPVVPSLDPGWSANFVPPVVSHMRTTTACIPTDVVFYAATDWLRIAQKMRANMSPCASYYVSIPPLAADKTKPRGPNQAPLIRALGSNFHAVNEVNVAAATSWAAWVATPGNGTWYDAGVEARRRMESTDAGGFDVAAGDIWAVNEFTSAVRAGTGSSRQNMRDFVHGLYDGASGTPVKGLVWISNMSQSLTFFDTYRGNVKSWFGDQAFWADMSQYVRFVSQEVYGRVASWAFPGTTPQDRLAPTADYLQHFVNFAGSGAYALGDTASYLAGADAPVGNAAWSSGVYEWPSPAVDYTLAAAYTAGQVYAFRHEQDGRPSQAFGFAWSPTNPGLTTADFNTKTAFIADRIAAAIHASDAPAAEPGLAACGIELSWCTGDLADASFNPGWLIFHDWTQPTAQASSQIVQENEAGQLSLPATDPDPSQQLTFSIVTSPAHGTITTDGSAAVTYTPEADYTGADSFTFKASDGWMNSNTATVTLKVNAPPVVDAGPAVTAPWGVPVAFSGAASDPDGSSDSLLASWKFGDGSTGAGLETTHAYFAPGAYTAELAVTDADGGVARDTAAVAVVPRTSSLTMTTKTALRSGATVTAHLGDSVDVLSARLLGHVVTFTRGGASCTATTDATGNASCALPASALSLGPATVTVQFAGDTLYSSSTGTGRLIVYERPPGGLFVIGDHSTTRAVTFWSPLWSLRNMLSGGPAPMSFKGFATATESGGWIASSGFSGAPESIPEWMAVLVASKVDKVGSSIHVTVSRMVVVHVGAYNDHLIGIGIVAGTID